MYSELDLVTADFSLPFVNGRFPMDSEKAPGKIPEVVKRLPRAIRMSEQLENPKS